MDEVWADVGKNSGWLGGAGESWERGPYYIDGLLPLAYSLQDGVLIDKAKRYIEWTLRSQKPAGMFGPSTNNDWWPRMVMLKALTQFAEATGDKRVEPFLHRYFLYQLGELPRRPLKDWGRFRWQDNVLSVLWLYERIGDVQLLELARLLREQGFDWVGSFRDFRFTGVTTAELFGTGPSHGLSEVALATHGVNNGQAIKAGPVWYRISGSAEDHNGAHNMIDTLDRYHGLPNGMFSCDEHLAGRDPSHGSELCAVVEYMFSLVQALAITGEAALGDRLEKLAFNALPGTFTDDMWAHQYDPEPNQVECSLHRKPWTTDGPESNIYGLEPNFGCCTANFSQGWPKFLTSLFMRSADNGIAVVAYAPATVSTAVKGRTVKVTQLTEYPFQGLVRLIIDPEEPVEFPLHLRIPSWAIGTQLRVNGTVTGTPRAATFAILTRTWKKGDEIAIEFPMQPRDVHGFNNSISIERGPLVFSYDIGENWLVWRDRGRSRDWQVYPAAAWNYALDLPNGPILEEAEVREHAVGAIPFGAAKPAVTISVAAKKIDNWVAIDGVAEPPPLHPEQNSSPSQKIQLIPYAAAKLRITSFPSLQAEKD